MSGFLDLFTSRSCKAALKVWNVNPMFKPAQWTPFTDYLVGFEGFLFDEIPAASSIHGRASLPTQGRAS